MEEKFNGYVWNKTVFAVFQNDSLKVELEKWALTNNINIAWGDPNSPDIIVFPYFSAIIDRNILGKEVYYQYLDFVREVNTPLNLEKDEHICILLDNIKDLEYPKLDYVMQVNTGHKNAIKWIIQTLELSHQYINYIK
jgi:hypothetical protein